MKILVVDDYRLIRDILCLSLSRYLHAEVLLAASGQEAIQILEHNKFDLILMDVNMPGLSGIDTLKLIRRLDQNVKVLALSLMDDKNTISQMKRAGANGYIVKQGQVMPIIEGAKHVLEGYFCFPNRTSRVLSEA